jgi:hypothetical protein
MDRIKEILAWVTTSHFPKDAEDDARSFVNLEEGDGPAMFCGKDAQRDANAFARELRQRLRAAYLYGKLSGLKERLEWAEDRSPNVRRVRKALSSMGYNYD